MWPFNKKEVSRDGECNPPQSFQPLESQRPPNDISGNRKRFTGFSSPPSTEVGNRVVLPYSSHSNTIATDDPYMREVSNIPDAAVDLPPSGLSNSDYFLTGNWIQNPRARACYNNIQLGAKMGGIVGGIFGALAGTVYAVQSRQILALPATMIVCGGSFGFFLGCGMIIRCETSARTVENL